MMWYLSMRHQRGVLDATNFLRALISSEDRVLYLMPCHSTPLYRYWWGISLSYLNSFFLFGCTNLLKKTMKRFFIVLLNRVLLFLICSWSSHLHVNATLQFLTCPPNLHKMKNYVDEADKFYENPSNWFMANPSSLFAHYLIIFDVLLDSVSAQLDSNGFYLIGNFFHADIVQGRVGRRVLVFKKGWSKLSFETCYSFSLLNVIYCFPFYGLTTNQFFMNDTIICRRLMKAHNALFYPR